MSSSLTRQENCKKFEETNQCTPLDKLTKQYGTNAVKNIPSFIALGKRYVKNKYIKTIIDTYNSYAFECKICHKRFLSAQSLGTHIHGHKISGKEYFDKYLKTDNDGKCIICGKPTKFESIELGYRKYCSHTCCNTDPEFRTAVSNTIKSDKWQKEYKQKMIDKFGVDSYSKTKEFKEKFNMTFSANIEKFEQDNNCTLLFKVIEKYGQGWYTKGIGRRIKRGMNIFIPNEDLSLIEKYAKKNHSSSFETDVVEYIKTIYTQEIKTSDRQIIKPLELDIYIPDKKFAIEVDGIHWHSTNAGMSKNYHLNKTKLCEEKGIRLLHIYDIEWIYKKDICKSIIASALGVYKYKIYARNCDVKQVDSNMAKQFLEQNHIQGAVNSTYRLGLFYNNQLVQIICIGKNRFKKDEYELLRMCTKLNTQVIGGFSKLLKNQPYEKLVSYIDRSKFSGSGYIKTNFKLIGETNPSYFYWRKDIGKLNRLKCQKHKLAKLLGDKFDNNLTEQQNMINNNFLQIYDCGNLKAIYVKEASF